MFCSNHCNGGLPFAPSWICTASADAQPSAACRCAFFMKQREYFSRIAPDYVLLLAEITSCIQVTQFDMTHTQVRPQFALCRFFFGAFGSHRQTKNCAPTAITRTIAIRVISRLQYRRLPAVLRFRKQQAGSRCAGAQGLVKRTDTIEVIPPCLGILPCGGIGAGATVNGQLRPNTKRFHFRPRSLRFARRMARLIGFSGGRLFSVSRLATATLRLRVGFAINLALRFV